MRCAGDLCQCRRSELTDLRIIMGDFLIRGPKPIPLAERRSSTGDVCDQGNADSRACNVARERIVQPQSVCIEAMLREEHTGIQCEQSQPLRAAVIIKLVRCNDMRQANIERIVRHRQRDEIVTRSGS